MSKQNLFNIENTKTTSKLVDATLLHWKEWCIACDMVRKIHDDLASTYHEPLELKIPYSNSEELQIQKDHQISDMITKC